MKRAWRTISEDALLPPVDKNSASFPHPTTPAVGIAFSNRTLSGHRSILCAVLQDCFVKAGRYGITIVFAGGSQEAHQQFIRLEAHARRAG